MLRVACGCGHVFGAEPALAGGLTNCPRCGKATPVPGFNDPFWRALQMLAVVLVAALGAGLWLWQGPLVGLAGALSLAALLWLVSRAF